MPPSGSVTSYASPTRFASGGRLTARVGQDITARQCAQRHPLSPRPCGLCLSLLLALGRIAWGYLCDSSLFSRTGEETERRDGKASPTKAGDLLVAFL
jgi:hypothetical protein